ncbi:MAG: ABC transporter substrate-binding protein, partial [Nodosilinea sp.]
MSENFSRVGRRKFLATAGIAATGSVLLKACVGNPPSSNTSTGSAPAPGPVAAGDAPEVTTAKLGYLPIVESTPLIIAKEKGFFA